MFFKVTAIFNVQTKSVMNIQSLEPTHRKIRGQQGWEKQCIIPRLPVTVTAEADWQVVCKRNNVPQIEH